MNIMRTGKRDGLLERKKRKEKEKTLKWAKKDS